MNYTLMLTIFVACLIINAIVLAYINNTLMPRLNGLDEAKRKAENDAFTKANPVLFWVSGLSFMVGTVAFFLCVGGKVYEWLVQ